MVQPAALGAATFYLVASFLLWFWNPLALVSLVYSIKAIFRRKAGDYTAAVANARRAHIWFWVAVAIAVVFWVLILGFGGWAAIEELRRNAAG